MVIRAIVETIVRLWRRKESMWITFPAWEHFTFLKTFQKFLSFVSTKLTTLSIDYFVIHERFDLFGIFATLGKSWIWKWRSNRGPHAPPTNCAISCIRRGLLLSLSPTRTEARRRGSVMTFLTIWQLWILNGRVKACTVITNFLFTCETSNCELGCSGGVYCSSA